MILLLLLYQVLSLSVRLVVFCLEVVHLLVSLFSASSLTFGVFITESDDLILEVRLVEVIDQVVIWAPCSHHLLERLLLLSEMVRHVLLRVGQTWIITLQMLQ